MLRPDINDLKNFYTSKLGHISAIMIRAAIRRTWPDMFDHLSHRDENIMGCGYAIPYLKMFLLRSKSVVSAMPAGQGAVFWPESVGKEKGKNRCFVMDEAEQPLPDASISRAILIHSLEFSDNLGHTMREFWRLLAPEGRLLIIIPNRKGLWARADSTPFGHGRPFSASQIKTLLNQTIFEIEGIKTALYIPPAHWLPWITRFAKISEWLGTKILPGRGGLLIIEAKKRIYAGVTEEAVIEKQRAYSVIQEA